MARQIRLTVDQQNRLFLLLAREKADELLLSPPSDDATPRAGRPAVTRRTTMHQVISDVEDMLRKTKKGPIQG